MEVIIQKIWNQNTVIPDLVGSVYQTYFFENSDVCGIVGCILSSISEQTDLKVSFSGG